MKKYIVTVHELLSRQVTVEAEDENVAVDIIEERLNSGAMSLGDDDFADRQVFIEEA